MFFTFGIMLIGYWLMWDGYTTLQQPTGPNPGGIGFVDLILPSRISKVDNADFWKGSKSTPNPNHAPGQGGTDSPNNPPGAIPTNPGQGPPAPTFT